MKRSSRYYETSDNLVPSSPFHFNNEHNYRHCLNFVVERCFESEIFLKLFHFPLLFMRQKKEKYERIATLR